MRKRSAKMAFGNKLGVRIEHNVAPEDLFAPGWGNIVAEVADGRLGELSGSYTVIGVVEDTGRIEYRAVELPLEELLESWTKPLEKVFPTRSYDSRRRGGNRTVPCGFRPYLQRINAQNPPYSFRCSPEQTVNTTAPGHLRGPAPT